MKIDAEEALKVAELARLAVSSEEAVIFAEQISEFLGHAEQLQSVAPDSCDVELLAIKAKGNTLLRPDQNINGPGTQAAMANAPQSEGPYYVVPRIIE